MGEEGFNETVTNSGKYPPESKDDTTIFPRVNSKGVQGARAVASERLTKTSYASSINVERLKGFIERIERLEEEKKALSDDIKDIYAEVKGSGYDAKIVKMIIKIRNQDRDKRLEEEEILNLYLAALGMA